MTEAKFGLSPQALQEVFRVLQYFSAVRKVVIFGSRALGTYKPGSDIDLAVMDSDLDADALLKLTTQLNEHTSLPYKFDLVNYSSISNPELKKHIDQYAKPFFLQSRS